MLSARLKALVASVFVPIVFAAPAQAATPPPRTSLVSTWVHSLVADGRSVMAYKRVGGDNWAFDSRAGRRMNLAAPSACAPADAHRGLLLYDCADAPPAHLPAILTLATNGFTRYDSPEAPFDQFLRIGTRWLRGTVCAPSMCRAAFFNWHSGEYRVGEPAEPPRDLDSDELPLVDEEYIDRVGGSLILVDGDRRVRLSRCASRCSEPFLRAGRVVWAERGSVRGYVIASGRRYRWDLRRLLRDGRTIGVVVHARSDVGVLVGKPQRRSRRFYRVRWADGR